MLASLKNYLNTLDQPMASTSTKGKVKVGFGLVGIMALIILIAFSAFIFRLFITCFVLGTALVLYKKISEIERKLSHINTHSEQTLQKEDEVKEIAFSREGDLEENQQTAEKEKALEKINMDKTLIYQELFTKAKLNEMEKTEYLKKIEQKDSEMTKIKQDLLLLKEKIQQAVIDKKSLFMKETPNMKKLVDLLGPDFVEKSSFAKLNEKMETVRPKLKEEKIEALKETGYVDEQFHLTRLGYKELTRAVKKQQSKKWQEAK
ncbi:hypothetical protein [Pseudalkalibacillus caeni]|uniref:Uncharacterized protein n=1 Tax=Exobacillus caeni TaxID=2574798 RepID=A0A5R9EVZ6_9BACL|nr:hypothetical protein [Pseudalkalibacillus caeni]TLS35217.1 hypothetical protein FCL54_21710 [Pseudalkalibacillus caeni]